MNLQKKLMNSTLGKKAQHFCHWIFIGVTPWQTSDTGQHDGLYISPTEQNPLIF